MSPLFRPSEGAGNERVGSSPDLSRRAFLKIGAAALGTQLMTRNIFSQNAEKNETQSLRQSVKLGEEFEVQQDPSLKEGEGILGPNLLHVDKWKLEPVVVHAHIDFQNPLQSSSASLMLPIPTNIGDQRNLGNSIRVFSQGKELTDSSRIQAAVLYSQKSEKNPYRNAFGLLQFKNLRENVEMQIHTWLMKPVLPETTNERMDNIIELSIGNETEYANLVDAIWRASQIINDPSIGTSDVQEYFKQKPGKRRGNCKLKSAVANYFDDSLKQAEGYLGNTGVNHVLNVGLTPKGMFFVDPVTPASARLVPQDSNYFVPTTLGGYEEIPEWDKINMFDDDNMKPFGGVNMGIVWFTANPGKEWVAKLSTPSSGDLQESLQTRKASSEVEQRFTQKVAEREKVYQLALKQLIHP